MSTAAPAQETPAAQHISLRTRLAAWSEIMQTANAPLELPLDTVGKWLVMTRAAVIPMTLWSGMIGLLLAVDAARTNPALVINYWAVVLAVVGLVLAHATNNLINDYFDMTGGVDTEGYVRALYAPHPVLSGWITKATLRNTIILLTAIDGVIMLILAASNQQPLAGDRLRARRPVPERLLRRSAAQPQAPRPGRAGRVPDLGSADDRRHVPASPPGQCRPGCWSSRCPIRCS